MICGYPFYEYHHMVRWEEFHRHVAEEITLLCGNHHSEATKKLLPDSVVAASDKDPHNHRAGATRPYQFQYSGTTCTALLGNNEFRALDAGGELLLIPVMIDGLPLVQFRLEEGQLLLSLNFYDPDGTPLLIIEDNEMVISSSIWDVEVEGLTIVVRWAKRVIALAARFAVPDTIVIERGRFAHNGVLIDIGDGCVVVRNNEMAVCGSHFEGQDAGIVVGQKPFPMFAVFHLPAVPRWHRPPEST